MRNLVLIAIIVEGENRQWMYALLKPPLKVEYFLTEFGRTLIPLLQSIADWGDYVIDKYGRVTA